MDSEKSEKSYDIVTWLILFIIVACIALFVVGQAIDIDSWLIGGPKYLVVEDNSMNLALHRKFKSIQIFFTKKIESLSSCELFEKGERNSQKRKILKSKTAQADDWKSITIELEEDANKTVNIKLIFLGAYSGSFPSIKKINKIVVDKNDIEITRFYQDFIIKENSNVHYYKAFAIGNLSNFMAETYGNGLLMIIQVLLAALLISQIILFFFTGIKCWIKEKELSRNNIATSIFNFFDAVSREYAISIGFLGTVISIWVALESSETDYSDFFHILSLVKTAVFTTVLGLLTSIANALRRIQRASEGNRS